jgi:hypothetical protein
MIGVQAAAQPGSIWPPMFQFGRRFGIQKVAKW